MAVSRCGVIMVLTRNLLEVLKKTTKDLTQDNYLYDTLLCDHSIKIYVRHIGYEVVQYFHQVQGTV